jgi:hypothetical protein
MAAQRREWWAGETAAVVGGLARALSKRRRSDGAPDSGGAYLVVEARGHSY